MKKILILVAMFALYCVCASATIVTYNTAGAFSCTNVAGSVAGCGTNQITFGNISGSDAVLMSYRSIMSSTVDASGIGSDTPLGFVDLSCVAGGFGCSTRVAPAALGLTITVNQTSPVGSGSIPSGAITGSISGIMANASIAWTLPATTLVGSGATKQKYEVLNSPLHLNPASTNNCLGCSVNGSYLPTPTGDTSIQGHVMDVTNGGSVPEPETYVLMGAGLIALGLYRRQRLA
ncbi:MAG: PEP-CTERM sorting domain-containing protein [Candidatus Solibacter usitatus]|nr:PEP-CTERM sorting domain-containing protein [Candidatus Solibacter usitatus]